jgi:hypothetical protein
VVSEPVDSAAVDSVAVVSVPAALRLEARRIRSAARLAAGESARADSAPHNCLVSTERLRSEELAATSQADWKAGTIPDGACCRNADRKPSFFHSSSGRSGRELPHRPGLIVGNPGLAIRPSPQANLSCAGLPPRLLFQEVSRKGDKHLDSVCC